MDVLGVGETAGRIWRHLAKEPRTPLRVLAKALGLGPDLAAMGVGWLLREDKLAVEKQGKDVLLSLKDREVPNPP